ncbi:MAG: phytanoyl-CoA dioxygenase family protein [Phenylobacterium sp.]|uniref:phytanoyl-CoA dioxygenase family protein n=1 Tax=Phenylobacterium sp. TaxID=1871053 RepID=UPI001A444CF7|nr:phytanoyl-CoA dioxygenase family protein [Phenylobacterium sp.]MBL8772312.1 phytanoyl-CoA dioxygenase family protein [Phenylobacterium sp.]
MDDPGPLERTAPRRHPQSEGFEWRPARPEPARRLSPAAIDGFNRDGFCVVRGAFTPAEIAAVAAEIDPMEAAHAEFARARGGRVRLTDAEAITFTLHLVKRSPVLRAFAAHPAIKDIVHDLIGPDVRLYWDQAVYKKTEKPQDFPWHQDNGYSFVEPQQYLTLWIPLVDVDEANGCPWIAPGLHRLGTLEHRPTDIGLVCLDAAPDAVAAPARIGDVVVFSSLAPHRTGPNLGDAVRKAYILQYAPDGAVVVLPDGQRLPQTDPDRQFFVLQGGR